MLKKQKEGQGILNVIQETRAPNGNGPSLSWERAHGPRAPARQRIRLCLPAEESNVSHLVGERTPAVGTFCGGTSILSA